MGSWVFLSLLALLSPGIQGASLPYHDGYDWHFNQMGVHLDLALNDQTNPLVGGKAQVELPISAVWKLIEGEDQLMKTLVIALEKTTFGKLYDIKTVKADITYNAEKVLEGIYNIDIDYTLVHRDGTEEKATVVLKGKKESGMIITSLEVITKNLEDTSRQIILPIQITLACSWPNAHSITINGSFGKIMINIANNVNEVSGRGVWEYLGHQYKYSSVLSIKEKYFTLTCQDPTEQPKTLVMKPKFVNSLPTIEITGQVPTTRWFKAGAINTRLIPNELFDYEIKHTNGKMDMTLKYFTIKTQIIIEYTKTMIKVVFPGTYSNNKMLEIELEYQPTNYAKLLDGGNIKFMALQDSLPIIKIGGNCGMTMNAAKYEILFNDFYVNVYDGALKASFSEVKLFGKILIDRLNNNGLLPKISIEGQFEKDQKEIASVLLTTVETPFKLRIFYPYLLKNILNIHKLEYLEIMHSHVVIGKETTITTTCNFTSKKLIAKITPTMITYELLDGELSLIKLLNQLTKMEIRTNSYLVEGKTNIHLNENSFLYKILSYVSTSLCFKEFTGSYHLEVVDKAAWKIDVQVHVTKDTQEILHVEVNNMQVPKITTICNFMSKKIIAEITPTMMTYELLDGEVSLIKFLNQLTKIEVGTNSYLAEGRTHLHLNENFYLYNILSYVSTSLCFKDFTSNYHLEVVDKAAWKVDVQVHVTKDTQEILNIEVNNVQVPKITTIWNFTSKKFIAKITPTMMTYELLDGEVSLIKYLNQLTKMEVGTNSYLMAGRTNLLLNENFFLYNILCYLPTSLCFKDLTTNYHLELVEKAAWKVDVHIHVTKDTQEILNVEVNNLQAPKITTICNFTSKKFIAKITPTMITYELLDGEISLIKYLNQLTKMEVGTNSYLMAGKTYFLLNENFFLYNVLCYLPTSLCFKDLTINYHLEVVDKAAWKVDVQVQVIKDTQEILYVEVNNVQVPKINTICNFTSKKFIAKITPTMMTYELFDGEVSLIKYLNHLTKMEVGTNSYLMEGKTNLLLNENSILYNVLCYVPSSLRFKDLTTKYHLEVVDKEAGKVNIKVYVTKDTLQILNAEVKPTVGNQNELEVNGVPLVRVALINKQVQISTIIKDVPAITAIITWKTFSIFENIVGIQLLYKQIAHKTLLGWNINQIKKAFVDIKVTGSGTPILGDYKLLYHLNWYINDIKNVGLEWNGKVLSTGLTCLNTPLVNDGKLKISNYVIDMKLVENFNNEPYTMILKTKPLKIALLPFFAYP